MSKRRLAWIALAGLGVLVLAGMLWSAFGPTRIVLTAAQLQERINRALPREFKGVTVERATVTIADRRVGLRVEARASALGQTLSTVLSARGVPRYEAAQGEIFVDADDVKVEDLALAGSGGLAERIERLAPLRERVQQVAATGITAYLAARPIYRFKDDLKGFVLNAALADISVEADAIAITVSVVKLTAMAAVALAALLAIVVLIVQLVRHRGWGRSTPEAQS